MLHQVFAMSSKKGGNSQRQESACAQFQAMFAIQKSKLPLTEYQIHWKYKMSQVTQWEHHNFFSLVGAEKLHYPLLLFTGDQCCEDLQQLQFVAGHNFWLLNHQQ